jgi:hypothetical protein
VGTNSHPRPSTSQGPVGQGRVDTPRLQPASEAVGLASALEGMPAGTTCHRTPATIPDPAKCRSTLPLVRHRRERPAVVERVCHGEPRRSIGSWPGGPPTTAIRDSGQEAPIDVPEALLGGTTTTFRANKLTDSDDRYRRQSRP